ncbi:MAG: hypothetical protein GXY36_19895 [Chloroflexi bacterium]|nr:hypothetical protein [Chloroflexota bacterium]
MKRLTMVVMIALLAVGMLPVGGAVRAQDGDGLSDEEMVLLERVFEAQQRLEVYSSHAQERSETYLQDLVIRWAGQTQQQTRQREASTQVIFVNTEAGRDFQATITATVGQSETSGDQTASEASTVEAEARYVGGVLYVNAAYATPNPDSPALPEGWTVFEDVAEVEGHPALDALDLDGLVENEPLVEEQTLIQETASAVTVESGVPEGNITVDVITISFDRAGVVAILEAGMEDEGESDPVLQAILDAADESSQSSLIVAVDQAGDPVWVQSTVMIQALDLPGTVLQSDQVPEGLTLDIRYEIVQEQRFSDFDLPVEPILPPDEIAPDSTPEIGAGGEAVPFRSPTVIEDIEVVVMESMPMQVSLTVTGYQPDGCELPVQIEQRREGNDIYVEIYREMDPAMACPMTIVAYNETIPLEGGFEPGEYTFHVNDYRETITL